MFSRNYFDQNSVFNQLNFMNKIHFRLTFCTFVLNSPQNQSLKNMVFFSNESASGKCSVLVLIFLPCWIQVTFFHYYMSVFFQVKHFPQLCKSPGFGALFLVKSTKNERREKERVYADFRISWKRKKCSLNQNFCHIHNFLS